MAYTEEQTRQADTALKMLHEKQGFVNGFDLWTAMGQPGPEYMRMVLCDVLHLTARRGDSYAITVEGEKAYKAGFAKYLKRKRMKEMFNTYSAVVSTVAALVSILAAAVSWLAR